MNDAALMMMVIVLGIVWGGFAFILVTAWRKEGKKK